MIKKSLRAYISYDNEKNPNLNPAGSGTTATGITGEKSAVVLSNICEDYYGGHQYSTEWTVETAATCTEAGSKYKPCERCGAKGDITEIPATGHSYGEPVWSWSEDGKSCTVTFICENDATHRETPDVTVTSEVKTPAASTQNGVTEYTATTTFEGETYTATKEVADIPATGGGLGAIPTHAVTVTEAKGGTVTASPTNASQGGKITVTVTPDEGYSLASLTVTDAKGNRVAVTGSTYTFTMPDSAVTVTAVFRAGAVVCDGGASCPLRAFNDLDATAWYHDGIHYCLENGIMNGVSATQFSPNTTLNRAMIWTMLARLDGVNTDGGANWYAKAQEWAVAEGVSDGTDPMGAVTREQLVTMLWRFKGEPTVDFLLTVKDADTISDWAYEAMRWAVSEGIIEGDGSGLITPTATATRAQAATIYMRFVEL